jgi:hypothetical protein
MSMLMYWVLLLVGLEHGSWLLLSIDCGIERVGKVFSKRFVT